MTVETLDAWIRVRRLEPRDAIGWVVRIARAVETLHALEVPHGRITAAAITAGAPSCNARGELLDADDVERDVKYYSARRCRLSGSSKEDDVWALGVLLYYAATGAHPFAGENRRQVRERIDWRPASPLDVYEVDHEGLQHLLDRVFKRDETLRLVTLRTFIDTLVALQPAAAQLPDLDFGVAHGDDVELDLDTWASAGGVEPRAHKPEPVRLMQLTNLDQDPLALLDDDTGRRTSARSEQRSGPTAVEQQGVAVGSSPKKERMADDDSEAPTQVRRRDDASRGPPPLAARGAAPLSRPPNEKGGPPLGPDDAAFSRKTPAAGVSATIAGVARASGVTPSRPPPQPRKANTTTLILACLLVAIGGGAAFVLRPEIEQLLASKKPATPPVAPAPSQHASVATSAAASSVPSALPGLASSEPRLDVPRDFAVCVAEVFEPGTFENPGMPPRFDFLCTEKDPRKAADALKTEVVLGKGERPVTPAMRLFSQLGWYEMAFAAAARSRCCMRPVAIESQVGGAPCDYDVALVALGDAAVHSDDDGFRDALARYSRAVLCIVGMGSSRVYGRGGAPGGGEAAAFVRGMSFVRTMEQAKTGR